VNKRATGVAEKRVFHPTEHSAMMPRSTSLPSNLQSVAHGSNS